MLSEQENNSFDHQAKTVKSIYVFEAPVRIWHWVTVFSMFTMIGTGIFIGTPFLVQPGHDEDMFFMGYIRLAHFIAAYIFTIALLGRLYWAFVGNEHARQMFLPPLLNFQWWSEVFYEFRWYFFLEDQPKKYAGHNPLALAMMFFFFVFCSLVMIVTGFALYSETYVEGHWTTAMFGWVIPAVGDSQTVRMIHRLVMWGQVSFIMVHIYAAIREDIMSRQSVISTMISGRRTFKD